MAALIKRLASSVWRLVFILLLITTGYLLLDTSPANAQTQTSDPYPGIEKNIHNGAQIIMLETLSAIGCQITGSDYLRPNQKCIGVDQSTGEIGFTENGGGLIGAMGTLISYTFIPPASSSQYIAYLGNSFGISKPSYAQIDPNQFKADPIDPCLDNSRGIGFCGLTPVLKLWVAMRNIVYLILILVFVVIGLAIMLRVHIDPRTVMSIQNQIPKIIAGIVIITFSFAIAGFLIDVMWVAVYLFGQVISDAAGGQNFKEIITAINPFDATNKAIPGGPGEIAGRTAFAFSEVIKSVFQGPASNFGSEPFMDLVGGVVSVIVNILGVIIIGIAVLVSLIRLWISLIVTYLNIILDVVFAPFWIIAGLVPGSPLSLASWFRDLIANLAVFPVVIGFFLLANVFIDEFGKYTGGRFVPPLVGGVNAEAMSALIGLGFILMLPNLADALKAALKAPKLDFKSIIPPLAAGAAYPVNLARGVKDTYNKRNEYILGPEGKPMRRGFKGALFGLNMYEKAPGSANPKTNASGGTGGGTSHP